MAKVCQSPHQGVGHQDVHIEIPECAKRADIQIQTCGMGKKYIQKFEIRFATVRGRRALDMVKVDPESRLGPTPFGTRSGHPNDTFRLATTNVFWEFYL